MKEKLCFKGLKLFLGTSSVLSADHKKFSTNSFKFYGKTNVISTKNIQNVTNSSPY